ncbi:MAG: DUF167 domain-containing protein [Verrucomicrobiaceae bacterium]|nr:DUF167 domain-containing protein [Verrucomicrobiaceae bacterium]
MATADERALLTVKVTPNAKRSEFTGWGIDEKDRPLLLVRLQAPPVDGKANTELIRFLSRELGCPKGQITLLRGTSSRQKTLEIPSQCLAALPDKAN